MVVNNKTKDNLLNALKINMGYKDGERVALIAQRWESHLPSQERPTMDRAMNLWKILTEVYGEAGIRVFPYAYAPSKTGSTVEPTEELSSLMETLSRSRGRPEIILAPTAYSLTHTDFMKARAAEGSRIATMSNSSLAMFAQGGPFDSEQDFSVMVARTEEIAGKLRKVSYVRVAGPNADLVLNVNPQLVHASTGLITKSGAIGNWLGAEAYVVPVDAREGGKSHGWFIVEQGFGGRDQFNGRTKFTIENGRFVNVESLKIQGDDKITQTRSRLFGTENHDIVAELGFGTNTAIDEAYLTNNWSIAVAEKMYQSKNGRTVHIAAGNSSGMGGRNNVPYHEDWLILDVKEIDFDYKPR